MHQELVDAKRWISERRFLHALNYCMVLPGPEAQQLATYIGWLMHRTWGGIVAGALFVLPSLVHADRAVVDLHGVRQRASVAGVLYGVKPAVIAIVLHAAWRIGSRALKRPVLWVIAGAAFVAIFAFAVPFPAIVLVGGVLGASAAESRRGIRRRRRPWRGRLQRIRRRSSTTTRPRRSTRGSAGRGSAR